MGKRRRQVILYSPPHLDPYDRPHPIPDFEARRSTASGLFFLTTLPDISAVPATSAGVPFG
jgi:hypothetical protein